MHFRKMFFGCILLIAGALAAQTHQGDLVVGSTEPGGGQLTLANDTPGLTISLTRTLCTDTVCLYSAADPGFIGLAVPESPPNSFPLAPGVPVYLEIVNLAPGASLRIDGTVLTRPGQRALLGAGPSLHKHPSWQATLEPGEVRDFPIEFRLTTTDRKYLPSPSYRAILTIVAISTPSATATPPPLATPSPPALASPTPTLPSPSSPTGTPTDTATPAQPPPSTPSHTNTPRARTASPTTSSSNTPLLSSPTPSHSPTPFATSTPDFVCTGDCNGDRTVTIEEIIVAVRIALENLSAQSCASADPDRDGTVTIEEIIAAVVTALQGCPAGEAHTRSVRLPPVRRRTPPGGSPLATAPIR